MDDGVKARVLGILRAASTTGDSGAILILVSRALAEIQAEVQRED